MNDPLKALTEVKDYLPLLVISGVTGAFAKALKSPTQTWRERFAEGVVSATAAFFVGGFFAVILNNIFETGVWGFLACGWAVPFISEKHIQRIIEGYFKTKVGK